MLERLDDLDRRILTLFVERPHIGVLGASRRLGVARGTVQARLDRLTERGVISGWGPQIDPAAMGYPVSAFCTLHIQQAAGHGPVVEHLEAIPEVIDARTITGEGDLSITVVARDHEDLQRVIDAVVASPFITRTNTTILLATRIPRRILPLVRASGSPSTA